MGLFDSFRKKETLAAVNASDSQITAIADSTIIDVKTVTDEMFAQEMMGKTIAFKSDTDQMTVCSPANGELTVMFPTGHAFGIRMNNGVELLVHIGVNTVNENGKGFRILKKKQGDAVKAGDPIVTVDLKQLRAKYDMSTMLIVTNTADHEVVFNDLKDVKRTDIIGEVR